MKVNQFAKIRLLLEALPQGELGPNFALQLCIPQSGILCSHFDIYLKKNKN